MVGVGDGRRRGGDRRGKVDAEGLWSCRRRGVVVVAVHATREVVEVVVVGATREEVVIIGDTPADIACGECISARAVAVATGSYSVADLAACAPHAVFEDFRDTERVLEAILC